MSQARARVPLGCRAALWVGGWIAPSRLRVEWRARWRHGVEQWWALVQRGEVTTRTTGEICRGVLTDALRRRLRPAEWREWARGPGAVVAVILAIGVVLVMLSGGLRVTRELWETAMAPAARRSGYDPRSERLFGYLAPIAGALLTGLFCAVVARLQVVAGGWRYWGFLWFKVAAVVTVGPLLWIEVGAWLRAEVLRSEGMRVLGGGLILGVLFVYGFGRGVVWCLRDQRVRCPVCLRRLAMPVALGSWASTFEPAETEMLCEDGHGALCVSESASGQPDRWTPLDASWRELFEGELAGKN